MVPSVKTHKMAASSDIPPGRPEIGELTGKVLKELNGEVGLANAVRRLLLLFGARYFYNTNEDSGISRR